MRNILPFKKTPANNVETYFTIRKLNIHDEKENTHEDFEIIRDYAISRKVGCSSHTMALGFIKPVTEMNARTEKKKFLGRKARPASKANNLTAIHEQTV
jgi:hypothetical protein